MRRSIVSVPFFIGFALLAACGGGGGSSSGGLPPAPAPSSATPTPAPTPTPSPAPSGSAIAADFTQLGPSVSADVLGASQVTWTTITSPNTAAIMQSMGLKLIRWPGGSESDAYHWENGGSLCANGGGYIANGSTFDNFMQDDVIPAGFDVAVTVDYGSNAACTAGGDPSEAAAWVAYAKSKGYNVKYWTVGNEVFGSWEYDLHAPAHDAATYANAVATGYYPQMKAADPSAQVGVVVSGDYDPSWDATVLKNAKYDFVEFHYYAQTPGQESDSWLLDSGPQDLATQLQNLRASMSANGAAPTVPIYVGEINSVYANPGKQTVSVVNALWASMAIAEMMKQGIPMATWWTAFGGCDVGNNDSASLYGWQDFGTYTLFSDGIPTPWECPSISENIPFGTPFPSARAYQLMAQFAPAGSHTAATSVPASLNLVRAYAAQTPAGYSLLLLNLDPNAATSVTLALSGAARSSFAATSLLYGKAQYDDSKSGTWTAPVQQSLGTIAFPYALTLPPYSMTVITLK